MNCRTVLKISQFEMQWLIQDKHDLDWGRPPDQPRRKHVNIKQALNLLVETQFCSKSILQKNMFDRPYQSRQWRNHSSSSGFEALARKSLWVELYHTVGFCDFTYSRVESSSADSQRTSIFLRLDAELPCRCLNYVLL